MGLHNLAIPEEEGINMANAFSTPDVQIDIPGSIGKGLSNANAMRQNELMKMQQEEAQRQLDAQNRTRGYLKNAMVPGADANAIYGNARKEAMQAQDPEALDKFQSVIAGMNEQQLKQEITRMELFGGLAGDGLRQHDALLKAGKTPEEADAAMQPYHDRVIQIAEKYGINDLLSTFKRPSYARFLKESAIHNRIVEEAMMAKISIAQQNADANTTRAEAKKTKAEAKTSKDKEKSDATEKIIKGIEDQLRNPEDKLAALTAAEKGWDAGKSQSAIRREALEAAIANKKARLESKNTGDKPSWIGEKLNSIFGGSKTKPAGGPPIDQSKLPNPSEHKGKTIVEKNHGVPTGRTLKSDGRKWITSQAGNVNLAMNAADVPLGTGMANNTKSELQLRRDLNDAYLKNDQQRISEIERQIEEMRRQRQNVG